jgi:predicted transcriptional regulator of viral defense system
MGQNNKDKLFEVADRQQGYFTSSQAEVCGIHRSHFQRFLMSGEWIREFRGIYRLSRYPIQERAELVLWSLWSRNKRGEPQGVWSHETALDIYEVTDVMPVKMHMTVPKGFRRNQPIPEVLVLHYQDLLSEDIEQRQGYRVTKPIKTLVDIAEEQSISQDQLKLGVHQAINILFSKKNVCALVFI